MEDIQNSFSDISDKLMGWVETLIENLPNFVVAIVVMLIAFVASRYVNKLVVKIARKKVSQKSIVTLIGRTAAVIVVLTGLFLALGALNLGKTLNTLLAGAGISGLIIGLALQGTLSNLLSGVVLSFRKNIQVGNWVETTGYSGEIMDINLNSIILKQSDNNLVIIPNKTIVGNPLKNFSLTEQMRISIHCGVAYESDLDKVERLTKKAIDQLFPQDNHAKEVEFYFNEFADSSINFMCRFWVDAKGAKNSLEAKSMAIKVIKKTFGENNISIPFPTRSLEFDNRLNLGIPGGNGEFVNEEN